MKSIKELMQWRFACKRFDVNKPLSAEVLNDLMDTVRLAPSSFGLQAWKFVVVTKQEWKEKLSPACYNQPQIKEASALVFFCARTDLLGKGAVIDRQVEEFRKANHKTEEEVATWRHSMENMIKEKSEQQNLEWLKRQVYIPAELLILAAAEKGIDSCPMEGFQAEEVSKILELPEYLKPVVLVSLGYRNMEPPEKLRFDLSDLVEIK
jgi:nitroreductase